MAERVVQTTKTIKRPQLAQAFKDHETIVAFESMVEDLFNATAAANANAAEIDEIHEQQDSVSAAVTRAMALALKAEELAQANELLSGEINRLNARMTRLERSISDLQQAPL